jgi:hypothetical protein
MTDRELLELAAKAAGIGLKWHHSHNDAYARRNGEYWAVWNPLTDDGDALRLAVKVEIDVVHAFGTRTAVAENTSGYAAEEQDPYAATRRAIVRAAAEIGRGME